mmetsp:Transcript_1059/g.4361  ORF Transcript_1059/g.4361 Transcript_1059/m.4361 type:complete len:256 (+) Transcript_1059:634-1401(+)
MQVQVLVSTAQRGPQQGREAHEGQPRWHSTCEHGGLWGREDLQQLPDRPQRRGSRQGPEGRGRKGQRGRAQTRRRGLHLARHRGRRSALGPGRARAQVVAHRNPRRLWSEGRPEHSVLGLALEADAPGAQHRPRRRPRAAQPQSAGRGCLVAAAGFGAGAAPTQGDRGRGEEGRPRVLLRGSEERFRHALPPLCSHPHEGHVACEPPHGRGGRGEDAPQPGRRRRIPERRCHVAQSTQRPEPRQTLQPRPMGRAS